MLGISMSRPPTPPAFSTHTLWPGFSNTPNASTMQACKHSPTLQRILMEYNVAPSYLERRCREVWPDFRVGPELLEAPFTAEDKAARFQWASQYVNMPQEFWHSIVWLDETTLICEPAAQPAVGARGLVAVTQDARKKHHHYGYPKLSITLAVNAYVGVLYCGYNHVTTGYQGKPYLVRPTYPLLMLTS